MVSYLEVIILSIMQGISEWLPISSSGHLAILQNIFGFQNLSFDVFLHLASLFAVILVFRKDIIKLFYPWKKSNFYYLFLIVIAIIPAGIAGFLFRDWIENIFTSFMYIGIFFVISGILVYSTKFYKEKKEKIGLFDSLIIGILQAIAIFPGISRSGATISSGIFMGLKKSEAVKFSFILAIPIVLGASVLESKNFFLSNISYPLLIVSFILTFAVSIFSIKILLKIVNKEKFYLFGIYNFILGAIILILYFSGVI